MAGDVVFVSYAHGEPQREVGATHDDTSIQDSFKGSPPIDIWTNASAFK